MYTGPPSTSKTVLKAIGEPDLDLGYDWYRKRWCFSFWGEIEIVTERLSDLPLDRWIEIGKATVAAGKQKQTLRRGR